MQRQNRIAVLGPSLLALAAGCLILIGSAWGLGVDPSSVRMIEAVDNLRRGEGMSIRFPDGTLGPVVRYLPLYPLLFSISATFFGNDLAGGRWLNAINFAAIIVLIARFARACNPKNSWAAFVTAFIALWSVNLLTVHAFPWPEPLSVLFGFAGLGALISYLESRRAAYFILACSMLAVSLLASFMGLTFWIAALASALILRDPVPRRENFLRLRRSDEIFLLFSAGIPLAIWLLKNFYRAGTPFAYRPAWNELDSAQLRSILDVVCSWLLPDSIPLWLRVLALLALACGVVTSLRLFRADSSAGKGSEPKGRRQSLFHHVLIIYAVVFVALFFASVLYLWPLPKLEARTFIPLFIACLLLVGAWFPAALARLSGRPMLRFAMLAALAIFTISYVARGVKMTLISAKDGRQFSSRLWSESEVIDAVKALPAHRPIFTNSASILYVGARRNGEALDPTAKEDAPAAAVAALPIIARVLEDELRRRGGYYVEFSGPAAEETLPAASDLQEYISLREIKKTPYGGIYDVPATEIPEM